MLKFTELNKNLHEEVPTNTAGSATPDAAPTDGKKKKKKKCKTDLVKRKELDESALGDVVKRTVPCPSCGGMHYTKTEHKGSPEWMCNSCFSGGGRQVRVRNPIGEHKEPDMKSFKQLMNEQISDNDSKKLAKALADGSNKNVKIAKAILAKYSKDMKLVNRFLDVFATGQAEKIDLKGIKEMLDAMADGQNALVESLLEEMDKDSDDDDKKMDKKKDKDSDDDDDKDSDDDDDDDKDDDKE